MADINLAGIMSFLYFLVFTLIAFLLLITSLLVGFIKKKNNKSSTGSFYRYARAAGFSFILGSIGILAIENTSNFNFLGMMDRWGSFLVITFSSLISLFIAFKNQFK